MMRRLLLLAGVLIGSGAVTVAAMPADPAPTSSRAPAGVVLPAAVTRPLPKWVIERAATMPAHRPSLDSAAAPSAYDELIDDFEGPLLDPFKWIAFDGDGATNGEYYWAMSKCRASKGLKSLWAIGGGADGSLLQCGAVYPAGAESHVILVLDLSGWATPPANLNLTFDVWLNTRTQSSGGVVGDGVFVRYTYVTPEGVENSIVLKNMTSQFPPEWWKEISIDLRNACDVYDTSKCYDLAGQPRALLEFLFVSKDEPGGELPEGAYIDNVWIHASDAPAVTRTPTNTPEVTETPTITTTATITTTETVTPTSETPGAPTETPTPTETQGVGEAIYLPHVVCSREVAPAGLVDHRRRETR